MVKVPDNTTVNTTEFRPDSDTIAFAPELIDFIKKNEKLTTYRFGNKYNHFNVGDIIKYQNSTTGETVGKLRIRQKIKITFAELPLNNASHETYEDKYHQRKVLSGYYAYIGREIADDDLFLVFDFELSD